MSKLLQLQPIARSIGLVDVSERCPDFQQLRQSWMSRKVLMQLQHTAWPDFRDSLVGDFMNLSNPHRLSQERRQAKECPSQT